MIRSPSPRRLVALGVASGLAAAVASCATYEDDLRRAQRALESSEHERALAILRVLEADRQRLSPVDRAQYAYLRGMTDYRIGYRADARHWLAIAAALDDKTPGALPPDWEKRMAESLQELNEDVYVHGIASLAIAPASAGAGFDAPDADVDAVGPSGAAGDVDEPPLGDAAVPP